MNNNTAPVSSSSSSVEPTPTGNPNQQHQQQQPQQQQFFIQEEGGLERWFNLTITNVGLEAVADYTCVAVNAGGVMEENISLTFEEPEPVSENTFILRRIKKLRKRTMNCPPYNLFFWR